MLTEAGKTRDFRVEGVALDGGPQVWSSTYVRTCLAAGDVEGAAEALGRPYSVVGPVVVGDRRGRELGYPTANVPTGGRAAPADGVYAGWLYLLDSRTGRAAPASRCRPRSASAPTPPSTASASGGWRPTSSTATDLDLYGRVVEIAFVARIRGMVTFEGIDALVETMAHDVRDTRTLLGLAPRRPGARPVNGPLTRKGVEHAAGGHRGLVPAQRPALLRARAARAACATR